MAAPVGQPAAGGLAGILLRLGAAFTFAPFRNLWSAAFTSAVGTWMQRFAQQWLVFELTGSAFYLGLDTFVGAVPLLMFTLIGGVIADRYDRRHLLMASQALQMACAVTLTALVVTGTVRLSYILALSFITGLAQAFGGPAFQSMIPALVPRHTLPNAVALNSIQFNLAQSVGPFIGGIVFTSLGLAACFGLNSVSFLAVIVVLGLMQLPPPNRTGRQPMVEELKGGLRFVSHGVFLALTILAACTTSLGLPIRAFLPIFAGDPETLSRMMTCLGVGAVLGALVVALARDVQPDGGNAPLGARAVRRDDRGVRAAAGHGGELRAPRASGSGATRGLLAHGVAGAVDRAGRAAGARDERLPDGVPRGMPIGSLASGWLTTVLPTSTVIAMNGGLLVLVAMHFLVRSHGVREL